jgi:putative oxidoreductase
MTRSIPAGFTPELQSLARIIVGFLIFRHGMEQLSGFPGAWREVAALSLFGALKLLCFPGGILMMLGLLTRPAALILGVAHLLYWLVEPLPDTLLHGRRLFGAGGAPSDHILLPGFFFLYVSVTGPGAWSLDRLLGREAGSAGSASRNPAYERRAGSAEPRRHDSEIDVRRAGSAKRTRLAGYSLGALRIVAGFLFIFHGIPKLFGNVPPDPMSLRALAGVLECVGGPMLMAGLLTRPLAFLLSGEMAFAYFMNHAPDGFWGSFVEPNQEAAILNCFLFLFLWAAGPGAWSLDGLRERRRKRSGLEPGFVFQKG